MPRPDVEAIGTQYRRIPLLAIGKDIYNDTRLILTKLNTLFPATAAHPSLSPTSPDQQALERLLEHWAIDSGIFVRAAALIPSDMPLLKDERFTRDREDYSGRSWKKEEVERGRPEALVEIRGAFEFLEHTLFRDGREWVFGGEGPGLGDIEGVFS